MSDEKESSAKECKTSCHQGRYVDAYPSNGQNESDSNGQVIHGDL